MRFNEAFNGMLPAAIEKFEELLVAVPKAKVVKGYDVDAGPDSLFAWGCACRMVAPDMDALQTSAKKLGITCLGDGNMTYAGERKIADFKAFRVDGRLALKSEKELEMEVMK